MNGYRLILPDVQADKVEPLVNYEWGIVQWEGNRRILIVKDKTAALAALGSTSDPDLAYLARRVDSPLLPQWEVTA